MLTMDVDFWSSAVFALVAAVGVWVDLNVKLTKTEGRLTHLEADRDEIKDLMRELRAAIEDLRVVIASKSKK